MRGTRHSDFPAIGDEMKFLHVVQHDDEEWCRAHKKQLSLPRTWSSNFLIFQFNYTKEEQNEKKNEKLNCEEHNLRKLRTVYDDDALRTSLRDLKIGIRLLPMAPDSHAHTDGIRLSGNWKEN